MQQDDRPLLLPQLLNITGTYLKAAEYLSNGIVYTEYHTFCLYRHNNRNVLKVIDIVIIRNPPTTELEQPRKFRVPSRLAITRARAARSSPRRSIESTVFNSVDEPFCTCYY